MCDKTASDDGYAKKEELNVFSYTIILDKNERCFFVTVPAVLTCTTQTDITAVPARDGLADTL